MKQHLCTVLTFVCVLTISCNAPKKSEIVEKNILNASGMIRNQLGAIDESGEILNPRTIDESGKVVYVNREDWTSGFFPGTLWYMYDLTGDVFWKKKAAEFTETLDSVKYLTWHHDVGFIINCSYGNGYRLTQNDAYKDVIIKTAQSLSTRFRPNAGILQSWDANKGWQATRGWQCPVIIDNMMNLELLFRATEFSKDSSFYHIAVSHADNTIKNHFRPDYSCYHVIDYDSITGKVRNKHTAQGYAHESSWARGQAWALYGYVVCYRETKDPRYLKQAENISRFLFSNPNMPGDLVPFWDFDAPAIPIEPRDVSAAAIIASALYELSSYSGNNYKQKADRIIESLSSSDYLAKKGTNGNFLLMHSVGSIPHNAEIDVPLNYADYYFVEALKRKKELEINSKD